MATTDNRQYISRIVLTPESENAPFPHMEMERDYGDISGSWEMGRALTEQTYKIHVPRGWQITCETDYTKRFKQIAAVVGKHDAHAVLAALDGPVSSNWEQKAYLAAGRYEEDDDE